MLQLYATQLREARPIVAAGGKQKLAKEQR